MILLTGLANLSWFNKVTLVMLALVFLLIIFGAIGKLGKKNRPKDKKE
jgi:hypothetical protein